jgi:MFS family permease
VNLVGIRKILKKYNKAVQTLDDPQYYYVMGGKQDVHLQQLANSESVEAIESSLQSALVQFYYNDPTLDTDPDRALKYFRFQSIIQASYVIRQNSEIVNRPFNEFLSRKAMIFTGSNLGGLDGGAMHAMDHLLRFDPSAMLTYDKSELEELWSVWIPQYKNWKNRQAVLVETDDWSRLSDARKGATVLVPKGKDGIDTIGRREFYPPQSPDKDVMYEKSWGGVDMMSFVINVLSILLYTINYYIVAPTANHYASILGTDGAFGATLIGASSFSAIFAAFLYSFWYTKASFRSVLIFSTICPLVGNLVYALAISYRSMGMALAGRVLCGFGSCEVVNRQLISTCVSFRFMTSASAVFVAFSAMGMSIGPLIAAILDRTTGRDLIVDLKLPFTPTGGIIFDHVTSPGFLMAGIWFLEMLALIFLFREPDRINGSESAENDTEFDKDVEYEDEMTPLTQKGFGSIEGSIGSSMLSASSGSSLSIPRKPSGFWGEIHLTWSLFVKSPGLSVTLLIFCFIELADEVLISSCSMVVRRYFGWHGAAAGFLIAALGALVLPANFVVENCSHQVSERRILKVGNTH